MVPPGSIECGHCKGSGHIKCECASHHCKRVENHPLNSVDHEGSFSRQGYSIMVCTKCNRVWGVRYQWDLGAGSDNRYHDFGIGDPFELAKERHY